MYDCHSQDNRWCLMIMFVTPFAKCQAIISEDITIKDAVLPGWVSYQIRKIACRKIACDTCQDRKPMVAGKTFQWFPALAQFYVSGKRPMGIPITWIMIIKIKTVSWQSYLHEANPYTWKYSLYIEMALWDLAVPPGGLPLTFTHLPSWLCLYWTI